MADDQQFEHQEPTGTLVFELRISYTGELPQQGSLINEHALLTSALMAVKDADIEDDAYARVTGVEIVRTA